jgi:hypothetical protein
VSDSALVEDRTPAPRRTSPLLLIVAWLVVGIPAAWGVSQTVMRSMDLFTSPPPATTPSTTNKSS